MVQYIKELYIINQMEEIKMGNYLVIEDNREEIAHKHLCSMNSVGSSSMSQIIDSVNEFKNNMKDDNDDE